LVGGDHRIAAEVKGLSTKDLISLKGVEKAMLIVDLGPYNINYFSFQTTHNKRKAALISSLLYYQLEIYEKSNQNYVILGVKKLNVFWCFSFSDIISQI